jgi:hypothetical protein
MELMWWMQRLSVGRQGRSSRRGCSVGPTKTRRPLLHEIHTSTSNVLPAVHGIESNTGSKMGEQLW